MLKKLFTAVVAVGAAIASESAALNSSSEANIPEGWLLWHSYTSYEAGDSSLYIRDLKGNVSEITGDFSHAMNGDFGCSPSEIVFMAIDKAADEWDIYNYNAVSGTVTNLTENSGYRNEDPKYSPDGSKIVFKRGYWSQQKNDFVYNIAEMNLHTNEIKMLTNDDYEEAMPYYSAYGNNVYYAKYINGISSIYKIDTVTGYESEVYADNMATAYYPIRFGDSLYFTSWTSPENHNDCIVKYDGLDFDLLPINSSEYNCSDACPISDNSLIYSCTKTGNYDLYYYDGKVSVDLSEINTDKQELGAAFLSKAQVVDYIAGTQNKVLNRPYSALKYDAKGEDNCMDLCLLRKLIN